MNYDPSTGYTGIGALNVKYPSNSRNVFGKVGLKLERKEPLPRSTRRQTRGRLSCVGNKAGTGTEARPLVKASLHDLYLEQESTNASYKGKG